MTESFADLFEESLELVAMVPGTLVMGEVIDIDSDWVTVNAGLKSEAVIARSQFLNDAQELEVQVGDMVKVTLESVEDGSGETRLSREKAKRAESWGVLETAFEAEETVKGYISGTVKSTRFCPSATLNCASNRITSLSPETSTEVAGNIAFSPGL